VAGTVVDTSAWVAYFGGRAVPHLEDALAEGSVVIPPIVVAELASGAATAAARTHLGELLQDVAVHPTPLGHWLAVGDLRRELRRKGLTVTVPDAHVAQCAIELGAVLLTYDAVFAKIARHVPLRIGPK